ncbi:MAG: LemA family protein [Prevotella sp.]|nr:LemA family protein [Prevotella sp.]MBR6715316.1 LemA family protein [Prevotella sp.]
MTTVSVIILCIVLAVLFYVFNTQRELVRLDELCKNAFSQIAVQLNSRWDAVLALAKMAAQYSKHESETIIKTIQARRMDGQVKTAAEVNEQQGAFAQVLGRLIAVGEAYPELKANEQFSKTMDGINRYEELVRQSRMVYNDTATKMNRMVRQWPSSIVASLLHFGEREYLTVDEEKKSAYPNLDDVFNTKNEQAQA